MEIHYARHAAGYVNNLNKAIAGTEWEGKSIEEILASASLLGPAIRNNAGGHFNHELFWTILTPEKGTRPSNELGRAIDKYFGGMDNLMAELGKAGNTCFGSGWAWLIVNSQGDLQVTSTSNQDNTLMDLAEVKGVPILGIDVWEHAYYLKYQNRRMDYLSAIWSIIDWNEVSRRYAGTSVLLAADPGRKDGMSLPGPEAR